MSESERARARARQKVPHASPFSRAASFINPSKVERGKERDIDGDSDADSDADRYRHRLTDRDTGTCADHRHRPEWHRESAGVPLQSNTLIAP